MSGKAKGFLISVLVVIISLAFPNPVFPQGGAMTIMGAIEPLIGPENKPEYFTIVYRARTLWFKVDPELEEETVFLGDSITQGGDWPNLFFGMKVKNRGIGGDTTDGVLNRFDQVVAMKPATMFLMIGTNDLCFGRTGEQVIRNYRVLLTRIQRELPRTKVFVQSILPVNEDIYRKAGNRDNRIIAALNPKVRALAAEFGYPFIDLVPSMIDGKGQLRAEYTDDGLHLSPAGYEAWRSQIAHLVRQDQANSR